MTFVSGVERRKVKPPVPTGGRLRQRVASHRINLRIDIDLLASVKAKIEKDAAAGRCGRKGRWNMTALIDESFRDYLKDDGVIDGY